MHVAQLTREDRNRRLNASIEKGDKVRLHPRDARVVFVSSETSPNVWHYSRADYCDCIGFTQAGMCRHAVRAAWELHQAQKGAARADRSFMTPNDLPPAA
jgi:hypothetical protein